MFTKLQNNTDSERMEGNNHIWLTMSLHLLLLKSSMVQQTKVIWNSRQTDDEAEFSVCAQLKSSVRCWRIMITMKTLGCGQGYKHLDLLFWRIRKSNPLKKLSTVSEYKFASKIQLLYLHTNAGPGVRTNILIIFYFGVNLDFFHKNVYNKLLFNWLRIAYPRWLKSRLT